MNMKLLKLLATLLSLGIAALGMVGVIAPDLLLQLAHVAILPPAIYGVAVIRVVFGALLMLVASGSRLPRTLRVVGALIVVAGLATPFSAAVRLDEALTWLSGHRNLFRVLAAAPIVAGALLAYAINPSRGIFSDNAV